MQKNVANTANVLFDTVIPNWAFGKTILLLPLTMVDGKESEDPQQKRPHLCDISPGIRVGGYAMDRRTTGLRLSTEEVDLEVNTVLTSEQFGTSITVEARPGSLLGHHGYVPRGSEIPIPWLVQRNHSKDAVTHLEAGVIVKSPD
ncbi:hypothetical protein HKX48_008203 [Thoreauomyces humboldtii]|nr:hypothetical protein HKX48_008203 [Thoreauomyces humboldtii]